MLECNMMLTLFAHYIRLHGYIHFIYLFNPNTKYRDMYQMPQIRTKIQRYTFLLILPSPTLKKCAFGNILLDSPSCGLRRKAKSYFFLTEFMPFKFEYNPNFDHILVQNLNVVFQTI